MDLFLTASSLQRLIYLLLVTFTAFTLQYHLNNPESYWLIWSAYTLSLITLGDTRKRRVIAIASTGVTAAACAYLVVYFAASALTLAVFIAMITVCSVYIGLSRPNYFFNTFIINLFVILSGLLMPLAHGNSNRFIYIILGTALALLFQIVFLLNFVRNEFRSWTIISLRSFKLLASEIFSCLTNIEYAENIYFFERRIHNQKSRCIQSLVRIDEIAALMRKNKKLQETATLIPAKLNKIYDNLLDCAQLRRRVPDYATFQVCANELVDISSELASLFDQMVARCRGKKQSVDFRALSEKIMRLEENYLNVLQVAAKEPLVFLLFIDSLKSLHEEMESLWHILHI